jgi:hypothetical protein
MKSMRLLYWPLVLVSCVALWWGIAYWLEPRPIWEGKPGDNLNCCTCNGEGTLIAATRRNHLGVDEIIVLRAKDGQTVASLPCPQGVYSFHQGSPAYEQRIQLLGKHVWRFFAVMHGNGQGELQFRSWDYTSSKEETIVARWPFVYEIPHTEISPFGTTLSVVWQTPSTFVVYRVLPTHLISQKFAQAFLPNSVPDCFPHFIANQLTLLHVEVCHWQTGTQQYEKIRTSIESIYHRYYAPNQWTPDGLQLFTTKNHHTSSMATTTELVKHQLLDGQQEVIHRFESPDYEMNNSRYAGELHFIQRLTYQEQIVAGAIQRTFRYGPFGSNPPIPLQRWRPLIHQKTGEPVLWPSSMDESVVGQDQLIQDRRDPSRYLYLSQVTSESPYCPDHLLGMPVYCVASMRLVGNQLHLESLFKTQSWWNTNYPVVSGQMFVMTQQYSGMAPKVYEYLSTSPKLYSWWQYFTKEGQHFVGMVSLQSGDFPWKKYQRSLQHQLPLVGKDYLLLQVIDDASMSCLNYECYALPMKLYSPWWGPGIALGLFLLAIIYRVRQSRQARHRLLG